MTTSGIKVLHIVQRNPFGGIFRVVNDILHALHGSVDFHVALVDDPGYRGEFSFGDLTIPHTDIKGSTSRKWRTLRAMADDYDVIHLHGFAPWEESALLGTRAKLLFTNHGLLGVGRRLRRYEHLKRGLMKLFLRHRVDHIANISDYARSRIIREYGVRPERNSVVFNCTRWQAMEPWVPSGDILNIGFHGRFVHFKRVDRLLEVAATIARSREVRVTLLGDGPLKEELRNKGKNLGLSVEFIPYQLDVQALVRSFDVEIISSDEEYFGLAVLESIQSGHPTFVFSDGGGCTEIFDRETEWFVCPSIDEMAERIESLRDPKVRVMVLEKLAYLQERVATTFSAENLGEGYLEIYRQLAVGRANNPATKGKQLTQAEQAV
jgi:glycosyltransferase involved in cell wall biosynthesis